MHLAYIWIVSHLSAKNYRNLWKFDKVLTKTNLLSFFGTRCIIVIPWIYAAQWRSRVGQGKQSPGASSAEAPEFQAKKFG